MDRRTRTIHELAPVQLQEDYRLFAQALFIFSKDSLPFSQIRLSGAYRRGVSLTGFWIP